MHIYLKHPRHGTKVAIAEAEALCDEKNGWVRFDPHEAPPPAPAAEIPPSPAAVENISRARTRTTWS